MQLPNFFIFFLTFLLFFVSHADKAPRPKKALSQKVVQQTKSLIEKSLKAKDAYIITESLTTEVGSRLAGTESERRARIWSVKKMKEIGLENIKVEEFKVKYWERVIDKAEIVSPFPQNLEVTALGGSIGTSRSGATGDVVRFETINDLEEAPLSGYKNKIIFVDEKMTRTQDVSGYVMAVKKRSKAAEEAGRRFAKAVLIRSVGTNTHRFPHTGQMEYEKDIKKVPIAALSSPDADQLTRALSKGKVKVKLSIRVKSGGKKTSGNVIGEIPGSTSDIVLIGAHLDSWDLATGAVDDGAGVGIVLGAAKMIKDLGVKPKRTIRVVLFGSEEVGLIGAEAYAKKHAKDLGKHVMASESDFGSGKVWRFDTGVDESVQPMMKEIYRYLIPLGVTPGHNRAYGGPDIIPMKKKGVPVVSLVQNGWDYFNFHHTSDDTIDKIKPEDMAQNQAVWTAFTWMSANISGSFRDQSKPSEGKKK